MKRILFVNRIVLLIVLITAHATQAQTTFHGNIARTGAYESSGPRQLKGVKWKFKTNGHIFSSPAIAGGVIFIGSGDTHLYAIDQRTGAEKWRFKSDGAVSSSPAVENETVYFGSYDGRLYAVAIDTGSLKWKFAHEAGEKRFEAKGIHGATPRQQTIPDPWDLFLSSPVVFNGSVFFGSGDGNVYSVDARTGRLKWKFATKGVVHSSPAVANNTVYIGSWDSYLYALNAETGKEIFRFKTGEDHENHNQVGLQSSPAVMDGIVYIGCRDGHVYAIDAKSGRKKWAYDTKQSWVNGTPAVRDGIVYVGTSDTHLFHGLDAKSGELRFTFETKSQIFCSAAVAGDLVYVGDFFGRLYAIDRLTGKLVWEFQTDAAKADPLKLLNPDGTRNRATVIRYFNDFEDLYVNVSRVFSLGSILSSPVVDHGEIYFGSTDGYVYALH